MINEFNGEHFFLSNFYPAPIEFNTFTFPTSEHMYQAFKTDDREWKRRIAQAESAGVAKRLGRQAPLNPDWENLKYSSMRTILMYKFDQHKDLADKLIATGTDLLVEGNHWHDQTWGDCSCPTHKDIPGRNALGILLMDLRLDILEDRGEL